MTDLKNTVLALYRLSELRSVFFRAVLNIAVLGVIVLFVGVQPTFAAEGAATDGGSKYKKYVRRTKKTQLVPLAKFVTVRDSVQITLFSLDSGIVTAELLTPLRSFSSAGSGFEVTADGFTLLEQNVPFASIVKVTDSVYRDPRHSLDKIVMVTLWTSTSVSNRIASATASRVLSQKEFQVPNGGFIRGSVINFNGDVVVDGEVNHSVIVFAGDIKVGETGVVRDHVVSLGGNVTITDGSKVYGYILPRVSGHRVRRPERPWTTESQRLSFVPEFSYNRVDGFTPRVGWKFTDLDSLLPELKLTYGIATTSERQRYRFTAHQPLFRGSGLSVNGSIYQELKSDDDYLIPEWQNTLYSLLSTTDYKNYYEAAGGSLGIQFDNLHQFSFALDMYSDQLKAIRSTTELWSLFGGSRHFYPNYQGIPQALADSARAEFDDMRSAGIILTVSAKSKREFDSPQTHWRSSMTLEKTLRGLDSDFSFTRFSAGGELDKRLTKYSTLAVRGRFNTSSGDLPLYRKFFLGGYRWLRGFDHKEFMGTKSWTVALDYGISFKGAGLGFLKFWMFYDAGQIADRVSLSENPMLQSLGLGVSLNDNIRLNIARRLDKSNPSLRIAVEL